MRTRPRRSGATSCDVVNFRINHFLSNTLFIRMSLLIFALYIYLALEVVTCREVKKQFTQIFITEILFLCH